MAESHRFIDGIDVDTEALAFALRRLADGIDDRRVAVTAVSDGLEAHPDEPVEATLRLQYEADETFVDVLQPVSFTDRGRWRAPDEWRGPDE